VDAIRTKEKREDNKWRKFVDDTAVHTYVFQFYQVIYRMRWWFKIRKNKNDVTKEIYKTDKEQSS
jgi:hypothetical protein